MADFCAAVDTLKCCLHAGMVVCNPAARWEKGQVEKNVRVSRNQMPQVMPDFPDLAALNAWLEERCIALWHETGHGTLPGTITDVWIDE